MAADDPRPNPNTPQKSNPDRLRSDIDAGRTGDKVPFDDPAAAPLGTDAEAGGHPATPADVRTARAEESPAPGTAAPAVTREHQRTPSGDMRRPLGIGVSIAVAAVAVVLVIVIVAFLA